MPVLPVNNIMSDQGGSRVYNNPYKNGGIELMDVLSKNGKDEDDHSPTDIAPIAGNKYSVGNKHIADKSAITEITDQGVNTEKGIEFEKDIINENDFDQPMTQRRLMDDLEGNTLK